MLYVFCWLVHPIWLLNQLLRYFHLSIHFQLKLLAHNFVQFSGVYTVCNLFGITYLEDITKRTELVRDGMSSCGQCLQ